MSESEWKEVFELFDRDNDGNLTVEEMGTAIRALGHHLTESEVSDYGKQFSNGKVNYNSFKDLVSKRPAANDNEDKIREAFKVFDKAGTGQIDVSELRHVLTTLGEKLSTGDVDKVLKEADSDNNGKINFQDFMRVMKSIKV